MKRTDLLDQIAPGFRESMEATSDDQAASSWASRAWTALIALLSAWSVDTPLAFFQDTRTVRPSPRLMSPRSSARLARARTSPTTPAAPIRPPRAARLASQTRRRFGPRRRSRRMVFTGVSGQGAERGTGGRSEGRVAMDRQPVAVVEGDGPAVGADRPEPAARGSGQDLPRGEVDQRGAAIDGATPGRQDGITC